MALTVQPFAENKALDRIRESLNTNVAQPERIGSVVVGAGLVLYGASRRTFGGLLLAVLGGALVRRGATGHCDIYEKIGINSQQLNTEHGVPGDKGINIVKTINVSRPPEEVYRFWRNLENLPRFMQHVESVRELDNRRSLWVVKGPMGHDVSWTAEIISDREGEMIAWQSLPGSEVQNAGSVRFEHRNQGTDVKVALQYQPPAGVIGATVARLFGEAPDVQLDDDLRRFKALIENSTAFAST